MRELNRRIDEGEKIWVKAFSLIVLQSFQDIAWPWRSQPPSAKVLKNNLRNIQRFRKGESFLRSLPKTSESVRIFSDTQMAKGIVGCTCLVLYSLEARSLVIFPLYHPKSHLQCPEIVSISYKFPLQKHWTMDLAKVLVLILLGVNLLLSRAGKCERNLL